MGSYCDLIILVVKRKNRETQTLVVDRLKDRVIVKLPKVG